MGPVDNVYSDFPGLSLRRGIPVRRVQIRRRSVLRLNSHAQIVSPSMYVEIKVSCRTQSTTGGNTSLVS